MSGAAALQCCVARSSFNLFGAWHSPESAPVYPPSLLRPAFAPSRSLWHRSCVDTRSCVNTRLGRRVGISARRLSSADDWALKTLRCKTLKLGFLAYSSKHLNPSRGPIHRGRRNTVLRAKGSGEEESRSEEGEERRGGGEAEEPRESSGSDAEATAAVTAAVLAPEPSKETLEAAVGAAATEGEVVGELEEGPAISPALQAIYDQCQTWRWKGQYNTNYVKVGTGPPIVLVHGFGASIGHWRKNIPVLSKTNTVYALDMIGYGRSDKPADFVYTMEAWGEQLQDFLKEVVGSPAVLMGNSLGSLTSLIAAAEGGPDLVKGCVLVNCAGGMNNKAIADDWRVALLLPVFWFIDFLLAQRSLAGSIFNRVRNNQNIQAVLRSVYVNEAAVDRELVEIISQPAGDEGALHAFCSILSGPPGPRPEKLIPQIASPILLVWGDTDTFIPLDGPIGRFFTSLPAKYPHIEIGVIKGGHCPHDDMHELFHDEVLPWLEKVWAGKTVPA